jgi:hypothetical protein
LEKIALTKGDIFILQLFRFSKWISFMKADLASVSKSTQVHSVTAADFFPQHSIDLSHIQQMVSDLLVQ